MIKARVSPVRRTPPKAAGPKADRLRALEASDSDDSLDEAMDGPMTGRRPGPGADGKAGWAGRPPMSLRLGDPSGFFQLLAEVLGPLAFLRHLILPGVALALGVLWFNSYPYLAHVDLIYVELEFWQAMLITILTASLLGKVAQGVVMHRHGAICDEWGIKLSFGVVPRFYFNKGSITRLDFRTQRVCYAVTLQFRLVMFILGMLVWEMTRRNGSSAADFAVVMASVGIGSFLFIANPLFPADGYHWFAAWLERPKLRSQSFRVLSMVFRRQPLPATLKSSEFWLLLFYAVVSIAFTAFILFSILSGVAYALESSLGGTGMVIFALMLASLSFYLLSMRDRSSGRKTGRRSRGKAEDSANDW